MLDLETMGKRAGCAIVSIGAIEFDLETGEMGRKFYEPVDLQSCLNVGLFVEASTIYWWMMQNEEARKELCKPAVSIQNVLVAFTSFLHCLGDFQLWGNGASFDMSILEAAYFAIGLGEILPWKFRNERDVRTLVSFAPEIKDNYRKMGITHCAIDDCKHQIEYCVAIWQKLKSNHLTSLSLK